MPTIKLLLSTIKYLAEVANSVRTDTGNNMESPGIECRNFQGLEKPWKWS